jgi:hypothetical protein
MSEELQSIYTYCYMKEEDAEKAFNHIVEWARKNPVPIQCYVERANANPEEICFPYWVGILFSEAEETAADEWLLKVDMPHPDELNAGVDRATEFNFMSKRVKVAQFWKGKTFTDEPY